MCQCGVLEDLPHSLSQRSGPEFTLPFRRNFQSFTILKSVFGQQVVERLFVKLPRPEGRGQGERAGQTTIPLSDQENAAQGSKAWQSKRWAVECVYNLKEKVLDPFLENENFRRAIKDYNREEFKAYDKKIRDDVKYLIKNLRTKYRYTEKGAQEVCMHVIDSDLAKKFAKS